MVIISKPVIREFIAVYPDSEGPLAHWYEVTQANDWRNFNDMKNAFNSVDAVGMTVTFLT